MLEIQRQRTLPGISPAQVWDIIEPLERLPHWFSGCDTAELLSGQGLGRRQRLSGRWGRHRFQIDQTILAFDPPRLVAWQHDAERLNDKPAPRISVRTEFHIELQPASHGTLVRLTSRHVPAGIFAGLIFRLAARRSIARMLDQSLTRLAKLLPPPPPA